MDATWAPTHRVPDGGLATQDGSPALEAGLEVMVLDRQAGWARVRCSNGWETWTNADLLVPLAGAPAAARSRPRWRWVAVAAVIGAGTVAAVLLAGGGDGSDGTSAATGLGVALQVPAGWAVSDDGLTAAPRAAELAGAVPRGPRVRAVAGGGDAEALAAGLVPTDGGAPATVVTEPAQTTIGSRAAVAVTLREPAGTTAIVRRYLAGSSPGGVPVLFILEAPEDQFERHAAILAGVPAWASA